MHSGQEPTHANADFDSDARDSYLVSCLKLVSAQAFVIYRMDPYVVVFRPSALGCRVVGFSSQGPGPDLYSCASWVRLVVLDTPADCNTGMEWIRRFSQQQKNEEKAYLANWRWPKEYVPMRGLLFFLLITATVFGQNVPPATKRPVTDEYHGVKVVDDYRTRL
jgi:hypothetical protein